MLKMISGTALMTVGVLVVGCAAAPAKVAAGSSHKELQRALDGYLAKQGNVCLGKFDWPVVVSERDFRLGTRDAVQMPVLEKLGLVTSTSSIQQRVRDEVEETVSVKRYELTEAGRKYYLDKASTTEAPGGGKLEHHKDLCAAKLSLDKVVGWSKPTDSPGSRQVTLTYTYHVSAAEWTADPDAQRVFPMLDRIIKGEGTMQLEQRMLLARDGWVAVGP
jgi:hypothetical protein